MRETRLTFPELALVAGTRAVMGVGLGFLLADRLPSDQRRAVGRTLFFVGVATTIPLTTEIFSQLEESASTKWPELASSGTLQSVHT
jgi:hypothetical protein